jgi:transposase
MEYLPFKKWETSVKQNNKVPAGKWHITITENDQRFYNAMRDCGAEGVFQFSTKYEGQAVKTIRQFDPNKTVDEVANLITKTSEKTGHQTYMSKDMSVYVTNNTFYPTSSLRRKGIRTENRVSQLASMGFDIDCHTENSNPQLPATICARLQDLMDFDTIPDGFIINTGRGAAIWMFLTPANPNDHISKRLYKEIHKRIRAILTEEVSSWGVEFADVSVDNSVQGINHIMRLPATYNPKAGRFCHVEYAPPAEYVYHDLKTLAEVFEIELKDEPEQAVLHFWNETPEEKLAWARARFPIRLMEWGMGRKGYRVRGDSNFLKKRFVVCYEWCKKNPTPIGHRHRILMVALSTACDNNQAASYDKAQLINHTFVKPLPEREVQHICDWIKHPFKDDTIAESLGIPTAEFKSLKQKSDAFSKDIRAYGGISYPVASSKADRAMLGFLIMAGDVPDTRISHHRRLYEAAQRREAKQNKYARIISLFNDGLTIKQIASELGVSIPTVKKQALGLGFDIVAAESERRNAKALEMQTLLGNGYSAKKIAELFDVHIATVYRYLKMKVEASAEQSPGRNRRGVCNCSG